jgi:Uma2 family endonuclease
MTTRTDLTLEQFLTLPETEPASEYLCGEVVQKPMPTGLHGLIQMWIAWALLQFALRDELGMAAPEWRFVFGPPGEERAFVPDVGFVTTGRLPADLNATMRAAPDLAVEVLSPEQSASVLADKVQFYLLHGVRLVWLVDPKERSVRVFEPGRAAVLLGADDVLGGGDVLPGLTVPVRELFAVADHFQGGR